MNKETVYRGLVLTQPWASAIGIAKHYETRSWGIPKNLKDVNLEVLIYAGASVPAAEKKWMIEQFKEKGAFYQALTGKHVLPGGSSWQVWQGMDNLPKGKVVAVASVKRCDLIVREVGIDKDRIPDYYMAYDNGSNGPMVSVSGVRVPLSKTERALGNYAKGRYVWHLDNIRLLKQPVPAKGFQRLFTPDPATLEAVLSQLKELKDANDND